ncbi:MAG TPA: hypothetical protein VKW76_03910 [Candidatus Binatia bacterium]|nr:hypothetical protein [Candidatus Binatia bacterium]
MDVVLHRVIVGGLLAWAAVSIAFGPELLRTLGRLRDPRPRDTVAPLVETSQGPPPPGA